MKRSKVTLSPKRLEQPPPISLRRSVRAGIVGTFDVSNFGDLLFPLIAQAELAKRMEGLELTRYSHRQMDSRNWPYSVQALASLAEDIAGLDLLVVGGGHLIRFDKTVAPGYAATDAELHHPTGYWLMPTLVGLASGVPVAWNCVGASRGTPEWARPLLALAVSETPYVSVRDEPSATELRKWASHSKIRIVPDTAFGIAGLLPKEPSARFASFCKETGLQCPYVVVQASRELAAFSTQTNCALRAAQANGCHVLELPISPVLGDKSGVLSHDLPVVRVKKWPEPLLIAELISQAEAVLAQSLHLTIVALATGVPVHRPRLGEGSKYGHIEHIDGVHLWDEGVDAGAQMKRGLGRRQPGTRVIELVAQLAAHWDSIARLVGKQASPRPSITASIINLCTRVAEESPNEISAGDPHLNGSAEHSQAATRPDIQAGSPDSNPAAVRQLGEKLQQLESQAGALTSETGRLRQQLEQQAQDMRNLEAKTRLIPRLEQQLEEVASEARNQLVRQEAYYALIARVRSIVRETLPAHSTLLVVSNGDDQFVSFSNHNGWHFPQTDSGLYAGQHPGNSAEAIAELDKMRFKGAQYLLFPETSFWWFDSYPEFATHLRDHYRMVLNRDDSCKIFSLRERS